MNISNMQSWITEKSQSSFEDILLKESSKKPNEAYIFKDGYFWFVSNDLEIENGSKVTFIVKSDEFLRIEIILPANLIACKHNIILTPKNPNEFIQLEGYLEGDFKEYSYSVLVTANGRTDYAFGMACAPKIRIT